MPVAIITENDGQLHHIGLRLEKVHSTTIFGDVQYYQGWHHDLLVIFINRQSVGAESRPDQINYRAYIRALKNRGVTRVIAHYRVGSLNLDISPQKVSILTDIMDFTNGRISTFFDGETERVQHVEMSEPYCKVMSLRLNQYAMDYDLHLRPHAVYVAVPGVRFATPAEVRMFHRLGGDIVGMTGMPELALAREAGMCVAGLGYAMNWAAGLQPEFKIDRNGMDQVLLNGLRLSLEVLRRTHDKDCHPAHLISPS
ncbi:MAG: MTAP family purine nucleoside phosphorylase [Chloroflexota bacterium]